MKVTLKCCCVALCTIMLSGLLSTAQAGQVSEAVADVGQRVFSELERELIREYYRERRTTERRDRHDENHKHDKQGKGNKGKGSKGPKGLPPGIAMKLQRGGELPPGIAKKNLPVDLEDRLPPRSRYRRMELDRSVVLVDVATDVIMDVIDLVLD